MKNAIFSILITFLLFSFGCIQQGTKPLVVVNYGDATAHAKFNTLELDSVYVNLLSTIQNEKDGDTLYNRWLSFHKNLAQRVKDKNFNWGKKDSSVIIWDRVYCNPDGKIEYYIYNVIDTTVTEERKMAYGELIKSLDPPLKYNVSRETQYAQCGSYRHYVY